jgi:ABC-2 type transport system permease protein
MTTLTPAAPRGVRALVGGRGFATLLRTESRVWMRDAATVFFSLAFPTVLLLGVGFGIPGMREPMNDVPGEWVGLTPVAAYVPVLLAVSLATPLLTVMPVAFGQYRERGVLRRLSTTPMRPQALVVTHLLINLAAIVAASGVMLIVGEIAFGLELPRNVGTVALAYLLGIAAMYSLGVLVAARAPRGTAASGVGSLLYFPMLFFAGVWTPGPIMPDAVASIARFTPLGAAAQAMTTGWFGDGLPVLRLVVLAAWTVAVLPLGIRLFRWQ